MDFFKISKKYLLLLALFLLFAASSKSVAGGDNDYVSMSAAFFDILQNDNSSFEGRIEYRFNSIDWIAKPLTGLMANTDGARYIYSGFYSEIPIVNFLSIIPSVASGVYIRNHSKDLHFVLEFRSQLEFIFRLPNDIKAGFSFNHISNASLGEENPGVESIGFTIQLPVRW